MEDWRKDARHEPVIVDLEALVPKDHLLRKIEKVMDYEWLYERLDPYYCHDNGRPGTDPVVLEELLEQLNNLIGLSGVKQEVKSLISMIKMKKIRDARGLKSANISKHLVFLGNPGTGKTMVARLIAKLYRQLGVLEKGQLIEVDRGGLVAGYVGQTALKTQEKIDEAMGGVLFIDEAYTLAKGGSDFGQEAIDTILKAMEDKRDMISCVFLCGDKLTDVVE